MDLNNTNLFSLQSEICNVSETDIAPRISDFLENYFQCSLNELSYRFNEVATNRIYEMFELLKDFNASYFIPKNKENECRIFLNITAGDMVSFIENFIFQIKHPNQNDFNDTWNQIQKYILYAHSICIYDPISIIASYFEGKLSEHHQFNKESLRFLLSSAADFICKSRTLIEKEILFLIPYDISTQCWKLYSNNMESIDGDILKTDIYKETFKKYWGISEGYNFPINSLYLHSKILIANSIEAEFIGQSLWANEMYEILLKICSDSLSPFFLQKNSFSSKLEYLMLPILGKYSQEEILSIRKNEDVFNLWRNDLSEIMKNLPKLDLLDANNLNKNTNEFNNNSKILFTRRYSDIKREIESSSLRKHLKDGYITFTSGLIVNLAQGSTVNETLIKAGLTASSSFLLSMLFRKPKKEDKILKKFYLIMREAKGLEDELIRII